MWINVTIFISIFSHKFDALCERAALPRSRFYILDFFNDPLLKPENFAAAVGWKIYVVMD